MICLSCFHGLRGVWNTNLAKQEHLGCLLEGVALPQCSRYVYVWASELQRCLFFFFLKLFLSAEFVVSIWLFSVLILLQLIRAILENPKDKTNVHLIYANVTRNDILLKVRYYIYLPFIPHSYCAQPLYFNLILDWIRLQPRLVKSWIMVKATSSIP